MKTNKKYKLKKKWEILISIIYLIINLVFILPMNDNIYQILATVLVMIVYIALIIKIMPEIGKLLHK